MNTYLYKLKTSVVLCLLIGLGPSIYSQNKDKSETFSQEDKLTSYFDIISRIPQEKLYLQLDKPYYGAGESIWFKGYLVNAITHIDNTRSNFITVELIDRNDSIIQRKKVKRQEHGFQNNFVLPAEMPAGDYYIRAYSNWMVNADPEYMYLRDIKIGNAIDVSILSSIEYQKTDDGYLAKIKFFNNTNGVFSKTKIKYTVFDNELKKPIKGTSVTNEEGYIYISLPEFKTSDIQRRIDVRFDDKQYTYDRTFFIPNFSKDFHVDFLPEGGELLNTTNQIVAFKALGSDGFSKEITGIILNQTGDTISIFGSEYRGMGAVSISPQTGDKFHAIVTSSDNVTKRFELPEVKNDGIKLAAVHYKGYIRYQVQKSENTVLPDTLYLLAHTRGELRVLTRITEQNSIGKISDKTLKNGITHLMLLNSKGMPISERLVFIKHPPTDKWEIITDKKEYGKREKVKLNIAVTNSIDGMPLPGEYSISITDNNLVKNDSLADNICSNILLTSDLKGYIEAPGSYFKDNSGKTERYLDFVMLTHGWKRFKVKDINKLPDINVQYPVEQGLYISGTVKGLFGKKNKAPIIALAPTQNILQMTETNPEGRFMIDNLLFPDSTTFVIQARTKKGFATVDITIDSTAIPKTVHKIPFSNDSVQYMDDYLANVRDKYYNEGGMRVINLKEIVVKGHKISQENENKSIYSSVMNYSIDSEDIERTNANSVYDLLGTIPGVQRSGNQIRIRGNNRPPVVVVDDVMYDAPVDEMEQNENSFGPIGGSILESIVVSDIASLEIMKGSNASIFGSAGSGGAIIITLKKGAEVKGAPSPGLITIKPLGYTQDVQFYNPKYETPEEKQESTPDLRSTIYWNPFVTIGADGKQEIEFYTSDNPGSYHIVIEGISADGRVCRYVKDL
ncbi:TonB-dependent receptor plug domain-containing protein [Coprobacter fastidiosus]|uniref:TonB-dependent receptor plug domain-containing protein n=1 Tax=Coprobacter fastidiosus TaxID=1099853 RepID=UPI00189C7F3C|nr:TonB-dependent receptor plug domain-containing protein [Coprobacter fastidiosus]